MSARGEVAIVGTLILGVVLAFSVVCFSAFLTIRQFDHHYAKHGCEQWGEETGREVRFADLTFWDYRCLVRTSEGEWIDRGALREVAP